MFGSCSESPNKVRILKELRSQSPADSEKGSAKNALESRSFRDGAIYLYRRPDYKKPTWLCRIKVPQGKGYINRSTRTTDEHQAFKFADDLYNQLLVKALSGETINAKSIGAALDSYIKRLEPQSDRKSIHYKILLANRIKPFMGKKTFDAFDTALLSKLIDYLAEQSGKRHFSPNTVKRIYSDLKHFFNWTIEEGYLDKMPRFPRINGDKARRPHFDSKDWAKLTRHLREYIKIENKKVRRNRIMLANYILILANTGIRVGEARGLKWRDISEVRGEGSDRSNIVLLVKGKTGIREVVARTPDVKTYLKRIYDLRIEELKTEDNPNPDIPADSLIFCHKDGSAIGSFKKSFQSLIKAANVEFDSYGQPRTLYSLRHTYATFRLHEGVNHYALAKNMGTSVSMLEQYYGHTSNITSADELTKHTRGRTPKNASSLNWLK
jgi:integrase